jgi:dihydroxyacetone kinase-like predicted kinase
VPPGASRPLVDERAMVAAAAVASASVEGAAVASIEVGRAGVAHGADGHAVLTSSARGAPTRLPHAGPPVVAVASGEGIVAILRSFGVAEVVDGGQSANPSAGELVRAAQGLGAPEVLLLPNNTNVKLAAQQAAALARDTRIVVVPTRNPAEGFAALLAYDASRDLDANAATMLAAARSLQTLQVADAVRDAKVGGHKVRKGHTIVLGPDDGLVASDADRLTAVLAGVATLRPGFELLTVYYGDGAELAEAEGLTSALRAALPGVDVELVHGGQPHYRYLLGAE